MYLRSDNSIVENYCHLLNITKSILGSISVFDHDNIPCKHQNRQEFCKNIMSLFSRISIEPITINLRIINVLQNSLINTLECKSNIDNNSINLYSISYYTFLILFACLCISKAKLKLT
jgi:hypothetical protein